jgi:hypothetical protein
MKVTGPNLAKRGCSLTVWLGTTAPENNRLAFYKLLLHTVLHKRWKILEQLCECHLLKKDCFFHCYRFTVYAWDGREEKVVKNLAGETLLLIFLKLF